MYVSVILSTIFIFCIHGGLTIDCPKSSSKWCDNKDIAQACGVRLSFFKSLFNHFFFNLGHRAM
jgi:hypothetical protein